jgi:preprotein translocase subunit SecG
MDERKINTEDAIEVEAVDVTDSTDGATPLVDEEIEAKKPEKKLSRFFIVLTILFPIAGLAYWLIRKDKNPERANAYCTFAAYSTIISTIVGTVTFASRITSIVGFIMSLIGG